MTPRLPAPGTPYHRMARIGWHRWWLPPAATVAVLVGTAAMGFVVFSVSGFVGRLTDGPGWPDDSPTFGPIINTAVLLLVIGAVLPVVLFSARSWQRRPAGTVSSVQGRVRWRWLGICLLVAIPSIWLLVIGGGELLELTVATEGSARPDYQWVGWPTFAASLAVLAALVPLQAAAEEYVFRGWLLQAVGAYTSRPWVAITPQAVLFAAAHGWGTPWGFAGLLVMGLLYGWLTVRTGGLEAAVALHVVNNLVAFGGIAALGMLDSAETAADSPWQLFVVSALVTGGYTVVVLGLARRRGVPAVAPSPSGPTGVGI